MQKQWMYFVVLLATVMLLLYFANGRKSDEEGFLGANQDSQLGAYMAPQQNFANRQNTYFHDQANVGIIVNDGIALNSINAAIEQPDIYLRQKDRDFTNFFITDPEAGFRKEENEICKVANQPSDLPPRRPAKAPYGCGWWFSETTGASRGALGTARGPLFPEDLPAGGEWIWNKDLAQKREDIKNCKSVQICDALDSSTKRGKCGFCDEKGFAVPILSNGTQKYNDESGDAVCGGRITKSAAECRARQQQIALAAVTVPAGAQVPPGTPGATASGVGCGTLGTLSSNGQTLTYTASECSTLGGTFQNGQCINSQGGSFNVDCLSSRTVQATTPSTVGICSPVNGRLTRNCLKSLMEAEGYPTVGAIYKMVHFGRVPSKKDTQAISIVKAAGATVSDAILGSGIISASDASAQYAAIRDLMVNNSKTQLIRDAAGYLFDGRDFDVCAIEGSSRGPFELECLQQAFRQAGCQASGTAYPKSATVANFATMTWDELNQSFMSLKSSMNSTTPSVQDDAARKCLGVQFQRQPPVQCPPAYTGPCTAWDVVTNGYREAVGGAAGNLGCFSGKTLNQAKDECCANTECAGFSYTTQAGGGGCFKKNILGGRVNLAGYDGYAKPSAVASLSAPAPRNWIEIATGARWYKDNRPLTTISLDTNDSLWATNSGKEIFRKPKIGTDPTWEKVYGGLEQVDHRNYEEAVGVNTGNQVWWRRNGQWTMIWTNALWASIGNDGTIYSLSRNGFNSASGGANIFKYNSSSNTWTPVPGRLVQIFVADANNVYGVNSINMVFKLKADGSSWDAYPGRFTRVAASAGGTRVVAIQPDGNAAAWNGTEWKTIPKPAGSGPLLNITVNEKYIAATDRSNQTYYLNLF